MSSCGCHPPRRCLILFLIVVLAGIFEVIESFPPPLSPKHEPKLSRSSLSSKNVNKSRPSATSQLSAFLDIFGGISRGGASKMESTAGDLPITTETIDLSTGVSAEVMSCIPTAAKRGSSGNKPPLVFIHGSFHAAWCWSERYFQYFASRGYPCVALSLRGTGGTFAGEGVKKVKVSEHVADVLALLDYIGSSDGMGLGGRKPVLISHSFGGLAVMKMIERDPAAAKASLAGVVLLCSVPPSGNGRMTLRFLRRSLRDSWKITAGLAMKKGNDDPVLCRELFFGGEDSEDLGVTDEDVARYQSYFRRDVDATIDLGDIARQLPSACADKDGRASFASSAPPSLVVGAQDDFIVDREGVEETARFFNVEPVFVDSPHDVMLTNKWQNGADAILTWLETEVVI
mmetsp:Transcript_9339/g.19999  ORF Transcript_9339/g.19999 Transcript_9339/m.19999 type:complete len:401 (-) Transcript_9339:64-1266(-)